MDNSTRERRERHEATGSGVDKFSHRTRKPTSVTASNWIGLGAQQAYDKSHLLTMLIVKVNIKTRIITVEGPRGTKQRTAQRFY
jgi:hypothetical protein